jgi:hypothetical protein
VADFKFPEFLLEFGDAQFEIFDCDFGASWCFILIVRHRVSPGLPAQRAEYGPTGELLRRSRSEGHSESNFEVNAEAVLQRCWLFTESLLKIRNVHETTTSGTTVSTPTSARVRTSVGTVAGTEGCDGGLENSPELGLKLSNTSLQISQISSICHDSTS